MARIPRSRQIDESDPGIYHCTSRCVRRAFLCGQDHLTGKSHADRRQWIQERMQFLASCFQIDIQGFGLMGNHFHCLLRNRPDLVRGLSDLEIVLRWWRLSADSRAADGTTKEISRKRLERMLCDRAKVREYRRRLSSISWFMSYLKQPIAVQANHQDGVTGCFWDGRFHSQKITNLRQLLAAMVYIDLNPIRAGMAKTPEESRYTGVFERIRAMQQRLKWAARNKGREPQVTKHRQEKLERDVHAQVDDWLSPVEFDEHIEQTIDCASAPIDPALQPDVDSAEQAVGWKPSSRASDRGILPISLTKYLLLVDWTGRQLRRGKRGKIPDELPSILVRLGISDSAGWLSILQDYAERLVSRFSAPANQTSELALSRSLDDEFESVTRHAFL